MLISTTKLISHPINLASHHLKKQCSLYGWDPLLSTGNYHNIANQLCYCCLVTELCPALFNPMDCSSVKRLCQGDFSGKNTGVGCHFLLLGIFPTQGLNLCLLHCRQILYQIPWATREDLLSHTPIQNKKFNLKKNFNGKNSEFLICVSLCRDESEAGSSKPGVASIYFTFILLSGSGWKGRRKGIPVNSGSISSFGKRRASSFSWARLMWQETPLSLGFYIRAGRQKFHKQVEKLQEGAGLGKEPSPLTKRTSLDEAKVCTHLRRTQTPASPAWGPAGSQECPETSHSNLRTTRGAPGSGRSPCSSHRRSALDTVLPPGSAPMGNGHSWHRTSSSLHLLSHQ